MQAAQAAACVAARRLHDSPEGPAKQLRPKLGQPAGQAAVLQGAVLRTVVAVDARQVSRDVARRRFSASRRGRRIIFSAVTCRLLVFARLGGLQQRKTKFPIGGGGLLSLRRQGRNPSIGREPPLTRQYSLVVRRLARPLGGQYPRHRRDQLQSENRFSGVPRKLAFGGALDADRPDNT
jgi:hypothetical protein